MSLINDALKKAQRERTQTLDAPPMPGGGPVPKRGAPMPAQTIIMIGTGCIVLVALSIGLTVFLLRDKAPAPTPTVARVEPPAPKINIVLPPPLPPITPVVPDKMVTTSEATPVKASVLEVKSEPKSTLSEKASAPVAVAEEAPKKASAPAIASSSSMDERVQAFLDAMRVTGIRSSGTDSRVLMNDRVYRVNDIVDRSLNLRLTKVQADSLTFTDPTGTVYVKQF